MIAFGAPPEVLAQAKAGSQTSDFEVFEDCWTALKVFLALQTQWRVVSTMSALFYQGIDVCAIEPVLNLYGLKKKERKQVFADLLTMQAEALRHLNKEK